MHIRMIETAQAGNLPDIE